MRKPPMKNLLSLVALTSMALGIAACNQTPSPSKTPNTPTPPAVNGTLQLVLQGIPQASVNVAGKSGAVFSAAVTGLKDLSLPAGMYYVDGAPTAGFTDPTPMAVTVASGQTVKAFLPYTVNAAPTAAVKSVMVQSVTDTSGALPMNLEKNPPKPVSLYAAQTEEPVVVRVMARDAAGAPVANANVVVSLTEMFGDHVAIIRGAATSMIGSMSQSRVAPLAFRDGIISDANGVATFTLFATYGAAISNLTDIPSIVMLFNQPAKIVVAAENVDNTSVLNEFKVFFYNIAHLSWMNEKGLEVYTGQRLGKTFQVTNLFKPLTPDNLVAGDPTLNTYADTAVVYEKQPHNLLSKFNNALGLMHFEYALDNSAKTHFVDGSYGSVISRDANGMPSVVSAPLGWNVKVMPNDGIGLKNLPLSTSIKTTLVVTPTYGQDTYPFPLKDFTVTKTWVGSYLSITKNVDHHVLTWAGEQHHLRFIADPANPEPKTNQEYFTLAGSDDPAITPGSVFTSKMTVTIKNTGSAPVYNVTIADALPAELGILPGTARVTTSNLQAASISVVGSTYDSINHVVTWNDQNTGVQAFNTLAAGASISVDFQVYLRQKPGFQMDATACRLAYNYQVKPIIPCGTAYSDPYAVFNGNQPNDVTGTWFTGAPLGQGGWEAKVDFAGEAFKTDVVINGVRPEFSLAKTLTYPANVSPTNPMRVGDVAYYNIKAVNVDLTGSGQIYNALALAYPNEFTNNAGQRDNPYGRNVRLTDVFDKGLDFISASPISATGTTAGGETPHQFLDKGIFWDLVPQMGGADTLSADLQLRADLPSTTTFALRTYGATPVCLGPTCSVDPAWYNCAYLDADNLNQPARLENQPAMTWQLEKRPWISDRADKYHNLSYGLRSCVPLYVILEGKALLEPTLRGEYLTNIPLQTIDQDIYANTDFFIQYVIRNNGGVAALDLQASMKFDSLGGGHHLKFANKTASDYLVLRSNDSLVWTLDTTVAPTVINDFDVTFSKTTLNSGRYIIYIAPVHAVMAGTEQTTATETYSNHDGQVDPLSSTDTTTVIP